MFKNRIRTLATITMIGALGLAIAGCGPVQNDVIKIDSYKGVEVQKVERAAVSNMEVEEEINARLDSTATYESVKRGAREEDRVTIDYVGKIDGKKFEGGEQKDAEIVIGDGAYVGANGEYKGFEEQLVGHKKGEKFKIKVKFPDDYQEDLKGKVAEFYIHVKDVCEKHVPEFNEEWVQSTSTAKTGKEYMEQVRKQMEKDAETNQRDALSSEVLNVLMDKAEWVNKPEDKIEESYEQSLKQYETYAESAKLTVGEFIEQYMGSTEEEFTKQLKANAEDSIKQTELLNLIAEKEKITVSDKEYEKKATELAGDYGFTDLAAFEKEYSKETIKDYFVQKKVVDFLVDNCKQVDKKEESTTQEDDIEIEDASTEAPEAATK